MKIAATIRRGVLWRAVRGGKEERRRCVLALFSASLPALYVMLLGGLMGLPTLRMQAASGARLDGSAVAGTAVVVEPRLCNRLQALRCPSGRAPLENGRAPAIAVVHCQGLDHPLSNGAPPRCRRRLLRTIQI